MTWSPTCRRPGAASRSASAISFSGHPIFDANDQFLGYRGASRHVMRQELAEQAAKRADQLLRRAIETLHMGMVITDSDRRVGMDITQTRQRVALIQPLERQGRETSNVEGIGLSLIIAGCLVKFMGGRMDIVSQPGVGTRVSFSLPRAPMIGPTPTIEARDSHHEGIDEGTVEALHGTHAASDVDALNPTISASIDLTSPPFNLSALRVLYVEDNRVNALLFAGALRPYPEIALEVAEDGETGLVMAKENPPHVLVLDAHLPGMSGFEVLVAMRQLPALAEAPAYMCSADAMPEDLARAKQAGFTGYWTKPIDIVAVTTELCRLARTLDRVAHNAAP